MGEDPRGAIADVPGCAARPAVGDGIHRELVAEVERGLERLRRRELGRRRGGLRQLDDRGRAVVESLTRELLRHAVVEGLHAVMRQRRRLTAGDARAIRAMFPGA